MINRAGGAAINRGRRSCGQPGQHSPTMVTVVVQVAAFPAKSEAVKTIVKTMPRLCESRGEKRHYGPATGSKKVRLAVSGSDVHVLLAAR